MISRKPLPKAALFCKACGNLIPPERVRGYSQTKFCTVTCRNAHARRLYREANPSVGLIPKGTVGAIAELRVSMDLLSRGYQVFRALSPHASCDLAVLQGDHLLRIEVTTAYRSSAGTITSPQHNPQSYDVLARVLPDMIIYSPPLPPLAM